MNTQQNYKPAKGEINIKPSKTVPGQTLPLKVLVERYVRGQHVEVFNAEYVEDENLDGLERMDAVERLEFAQQLKQGINRGRDILAKKERQRLQEAKPPQSPGTE
nr:MAG: hypothetical protein [Microvirus sp.]